MQHVSFIVDGQKLVGTLQYPRETKEKNPAILMIHGWMSSQKRNVLYAQELNTLGFIVMTFDLRSHGESEGERSKLSREDYMKDVTAAYDFLLEQEGVDSDRIGIIGSSFGSYLAAILSSKRNIKWLALRVPANYPDEGFDVPQVKLSNPKTTAWRSEELAADATISLRAIQEYKNDLLIIESELDDLCPHQTMKNYMNACRDSSKLTHVVMKGADHSIKTEKFRAVFTDIIVDWFGKRV
jgi:uncharacterized protein